jgi:membrane protease YdiL (CAAX protease family)
VIDTRGPYEVVEKPAAGRMSTIVVAVVTGVGVLLAGNLPWAALLAPLNLRVATSVPWAIVPMAAYLWIYWRYCSGAIGPAQTRTARRDLLRARSVSDDVWGMAILTGLAGFGALLALASVMGRVVRLPDAAPFTAPAGMSATSMFALIVMGSIVAGVTEEAGFRGYMQTPIERRFGLLPAILVNGAVFGLLHFPNHPEHVLTMLPYYIAVSAVYSGVTWAADSILPSLVLHAGGDIWSLGRLWVTGTPEWQVAAPQPLIWQTGIDAEFLTAATVMFAFSASAWWLCAQTRRARAIAAVA